MLRLSCFALLIGIVLGLELKAQLNSQWEKFMSTYHKIYTVEEEIKRQEIFLKNVEEILRHNLEHDMGEGDGFTQGINAYSDMTHEEFVKAMCGVKASRAHNRTNQVFRPTSRATLPDTVDWREQNIVSPVKDQGSNCGSCWAFSATGAIESAWAKAMGELVVLADQQLVDCADDAQYDCSGCGGGWPDEAMQYVVDNNGQDKQECYPYIFRAHKTCEYQPSCMAVTISQSVDLMPPGNEEVLKEAVANVGPISVCFDASQPGFGSYKTGIYNPSYCKQTSDHAVLIVGYGTENGQDYWLLKNSWGLSWGQLGYFQLARNANNKCGISNSASYPIV